MQGHWPSRERREIFRAKGKTRLELQDLSRRGGRRGCSRFSLKESSTGGTTANISTLEKHLPKKGAGGKKPAGKRKREGRALLNLSGVAGKKSRPRAKGELERRGLRDAGVHF